MDVMNAIKERRAVRAFSDKKIEPEKLEAIMDAGRLAPTARNEQRCKFIAVTDEDLKIELVAACRDQNFVKEAPAILVACADKDKTMFCGQSSKVIDCTIAMSFMWLEAVEQGIQGCWLGLFDAEKVRKILNIPDDYVVPVVMPIGYAAADGQPNVKKGKEETFVYDKM
ncbi:MAG: nitroreductase family protein [Candidatus Methanomethylophilaceae archaeon]|nr:nitroreductase family protein [Candidatus Methanomethylophilaceae archaeon]MDD3378758.1 nitroreductase family protein [Candidatus Methanomethylophilaceae archaeon]MDY0223773.1 nitroreductase family protein [Candidatus Methanomethylophilaceae archaeon]